MLGQMVLRRAYCFQEPKAAADYKDVTRSITERQEKGRNYKILHLKGEGLGRWPQFWQPRRVGIERKQELSFYCTQICID